jgi:hypothetical protein
MAEDKEKDKEELLDRLRFELGFIELGGYESSAHELRKELSIFLDSPSCLNYGSSAREHPCLECWLIQFVPPDKQCEAVPCHHIPLNERGETMAELAAGGRYRAQEALRRWLRAMIKNLESAPPGSEH